MRIKGRARLHAKSCLLQLRPSQCLCPGRCVGRRDRLSSRSSVEVRYARSFGLPPHPERPSIAMTSAHSPPLPPSSLFRQTWEFPGWGAYDWTMHVTEEELRDAARRIDDRYGS